MQILIDGYNLMHAVGYAGPSTLSWEARRLRFLDWLSTTPVSLARPGLMHVVFDAQNGPVHTLQETTHHGVKITYATRETADDRIEAWLAGAVRPTEIVVVSNDARVIESARVHRAKGWSSQIFLDWLIAQENAMKSGSQTTAPEKPDTPPDADETDELLAIFTKPKPR